MGILDSILKLFVGDKSKKDLQEIQPKVALIKKAGKELENASLDQLREKTNQFKQQIQSKRAETLKKIADLNQEVGTTNDIDQKEALYNEVDKLQEEVLAITRKALDALLPEAFALIKETAKRFAAHDSLEVTATPFDSQLSANKSYVSLEGEKAIWQTSWDAAGKEVRWDMVHYDVQLIGGVALHQGKAAEMQTGEGKTLVATLPVYLNALSGYGVHLVTVNDYLARRDSEWMAPIFEFHGLTVDCIDNHSPNSASRRAAYQADITYGTNNEFGFDYLRDNMTHAPENLVQRQHNYAIIDEVDSVLIDDARTPLIISGPIPKGDKHEFNELKPKISNIVSVQRKLLTKVLAEAKKLIQEGNTKEGGFKLLQVYRGIPKNKALIKFLSEEGVKQVLQKTQNFYMQDNNREMHKVDADLYFVIEEKNNQIDLTDKGVEYLSGKEDPNFFVLPEIGIEIAKIEQLNLEKNEEIAQKDALYRDYNIKIERIHTLRQLLKAYSLFEKDVEYVVIDNKVKIVDEQTGRIMDGRRYSDGLHQAIEAKENVKIEDATQTFATVTLQNYFRMYNKLAGMTGTAVTEAGELWEIYKLDVVEIPTNRPVARVDKEDLVYKTKREKYNAVIDQVTQIAQAGRPVLIGTTSVEISELLGRMLSIRKIPHNVLNAKLHKKEADIVAEAGKKGMVTIATNMAGRGTDIKLAEAVKSAGGLAIIGTERHDSRRVDRQLRGRSGRQGDPGSSQFYVSLEDNLMRLFGSERIAKMMDRMGLKEGEVIQHAMITKSIERAQKKVEENNFGIRKRLLEYDDVMNAQREVVYERRRHALFGERLQVDIANMIFETVEGITTTNKTAQDFKNFDFELIRYFSMSSPISESEFENTETDQLITNIYAAIYAHYEAKMKTIAQSAYPIFKELYEDSSNNYERIMVPFSDGTKGISVHMDLKKAYESEGKQLIVDFEKNITLGIIDDTWKTHLRKMDELKQSVQLAVHEQKDPLLIYKFEAFELFKSMLDEINKEVVLFLFKGDLPTESPQKISESRENTTKKEKIQLTKEEFPKRESRIRQQNTKPNNNPTQLQHDGATQTIETIVREQQPKIGRNEKVTIRHKTNGKSKTLKFKQAIPLIETGEWVISKS